MRGKRRAQNGRLHWAEIDDHLVQGVQYEAGPGSQDKKCAASQSHHSTWKLHVPSAPSLPPDSVTDQIRWQGFIRHSHQTRHFWPCSLQCWEHFKKYISFSSSQVQMLWKFISIESIKFSLFVWWKVILSVCKCSYLSDHEDQKWNVNKVKEKNWNRINEN